jgi:hypothetical protein
LVDIELLMRTIELLKAPAAGPGTAAADGGKARL